MKCWALDDAIIPLETFCTYWSVALLPRPFGSSICGYATNLLLSFLLATLIPPLLTDGLFSLKCFGMLTPRRFDVDAAFNCIPYLLEVGLSCDKYICWVRIYGYPLVIASFYFLESAIISSAFRKAYWVFWSWCTDEGIICFDRAIIICCYNRAC